MIKKTWIRIGEIAGAILALILAIVLWPGRKIGTVLVQPSDKEKRAIDKQTEDLMQRARVEAISEERQKKLDQIQQIKDPKERLKRLADELKDL